MLEHTNSQQQQKSTNQSLKQLAASEAKYCTTAITNTDESANNCTCFADGL